MSIVQGRQRCGRRPSGNSRPPLQQPGVRGVEAALHARRAARDTRPRVVDLARGRRLRAQGRDERLPGRRRPDHERIQPVAPGRGRAWPPDRCPSTQKTPRARACITDRGSCSRAPRWAPRTRSWRRSDPDRERRQVAGTHADEGQQGRRSPRRHGSPCALRTAAVAPRAKERRLEDPGRRRPRDLAGHAGHQAIPAGCCSSRNLIGGPDPRSVEHDPAIAGTGREPEPCCHRCWTTP